MNHPKARPYYRLLSYGIGSLMLIASLGQTVAEAAPQPAVPQTQQTQQNQNASNIAVILDRQPLPLTLPPILIHGSLMFPAKAFFQAVGVKFSIRNGHVTAVNGSIQVEGNLSSNKAAKGKQAVQMPAAPTIQNDRLYVPAKFVSLVMDKEVSYYAGGGKKTVTIGYNEGQMTGFRRLMFEAARNGDAKVIETMLSRGVGVNEKMRNEYGDNTALDYAVLTDHVEAAQVLLEHGGTFDTQRVFQLLVSQDAAMIELLLQHGIDPNMPLSNLNGSLLSVACNEIGSMHPDGTETTIHPSPQIVKLLLDYGGDPLSDDSLTNAVQAGSRAVVQLLMQHGADPYRMDSMGSTPYQRAVIIGAVSWFTLDADTAGSSGSEQPEGVHHIPIFSVLNEDGTPLMSGTIVVEGTSNPGFSRKEFNWKGEDINLDVPDGDYKVSTIMRVGAAYLPSGKRIQVDQGKATPSVYRLPALNVHVTIANAGDDQKHGFATLLNADGTNLLTYVEVEDGKFGLYLPPGTYKLSDYRVQASIYQLSGDTTITVSEKSGIQELVVTMSEGALKLKLAAE
ncbi:hypothetical protein GZH47_13780 [Paenibacillus rhizovicinus]|uniref:Copper amine oxidase-like N-terminal domain-containing protein n=1 Tax=Paenibacillus rhizovicinus TaxID=2704463 RepID=A0A6C0P583_9BACL|nr:copper amine oxidase N-terminal domain-containing protein [Paenibacillus rhizovicinus]QHW31802.1 hypothetical protein GZH47_13780 [Paenibacillus rhizovicinus]